MSASGCRKRAMLAAYVMSRGAEREAIAEADTLLRTVPDTPLLHRWSNPSRDLVPRSCRTHATAQRAHLRVLSHLERSTAMSPLIRALTLSAAVALFATSALAQTAKDIRGPSLYVPIKNEPPPRLIVDPPLAEGLPLGAFWAQYRTENLRIAQVFGEGAARTSPRVGHLHITVDDGPFWWADASDNNTIDIANFAPGKHKVKVELVDANHTVFPGTATTLEFTIPPYAAFKPHGNP